MYNIYIYVCVFYVYVQYVYVYDYVWVYLMKIKFLKMATMVTKVGPMCFDQTPQRDAGDRQGGFFFLGNGSMDIRNPVMFVADPA